MADRMKRIWKRLGLLLVCSLVLAGPMSCSRSRQSDVPDPAGLRLREFVGGPARLVWIQQVAGDGDDPFCDGSRLVLMGLDTEDGRGPRPIVSTVTNYHRPMLTPDGRHVVYSRQTTREAFAVAWDGGRPRRLGAGYAAATWQDPATGVVWVYMADNGTTGKERNHAKTLQRVRLDDLSVREVVWDRAKFTFNSLQLSADGTRACGQFIHPRAGFAELPNRSWTYLGRGCWTSIAPDNSYLVWIFDNPHRNLIFHDPTENTSWSVPIGTAPEMKGFEVYHPRWSNHRRFFTLTGPYEIGRPGANLIGAGGPGVEAWIGKFAPDLKTVESWLQITHDRYGDFYPDLWVAPTSPAHRDEAGRSGNASPSKSSDGRWTRGTINPAHLIPRARVYTPAIRLQRVRKGKSDDLGPGGIGMEAIRQQQPFA